jgi:tRNA threonylcarbamoyl adenosine modification protein (Sua5/YciO/YrdC/YwlC family)
MNSNIAQIVDSTDENIKMCAELIKKGEVVGMPTETVYGLAANAFNMTAVKKIFEYKGRPLSDPLIVHVTSVEMAKSLINIDNDTLNIFTSLAHKYWPGPLTIVLKANFDVISRTLTANTDYIGIRYPNNEIAKKLIDYSGVPLAAPSANKFCHVSPVNPEHVLEDFKEFPVTILNGGVCNFCIESTVIKIIHEENKKLIQILRTGAISKSELETFAKENNFNEYKIEFANRKIIEISSEINLDKELESNDNSSIEAPGQFIKHYSPQLTTYILNEDDRIDSDYTITSIEEFNKSVIIDYNSIIKNKYNNIIIDNKYKDLSPEGNEEEVMKNLYDYLRIAEKVENADRIILCDLDKHMHSTNLHKNTLVDRIIKAAAFKKIDIQIK